jgi:hypothetical protein
VLRAGASSLPSAAACKQETRSALSMLVRDLTSSENIFPMEVKPTMHSYKRLCLWAAGIVFGILFFSAIGSAQMDESKPKAAPQSITGCLQKGDEAGGVTLTGADGKVWELHSKKVKLSEHVGHTVTVTGAVVKQSKATEEKIEASEKKEASGKEYSDLRVDSLKMVSDSCK